MSSLFASGWPRTSVPRQSLWPCPGNPAFWKDLSRRVARLSIFNSTLDDSSRAGVRQHGKCRRKYSGSPRRHDSSIGLVIALLAATTLAGCRSSVTGDPATTFLNIRSEFLHGNLDPAQQKAE